MKAILYPRVSDPRQVENTSLEFQEKECRRWCEINGYEVVHTFLEGGRSAKAVDHRHTLLEALEFIRQQEGEIDAFVVYRIDRFTRQTQDFLSLRETLRILGCRMVSVTEPLDDTPAGRMMGTFLAGIAQFDNEVRAERSRAGMQALAEQGCWCWPAPLGYRSSRTTAGKPLIVPDETEAPIVRRALEMFASGGYPQTHIRAMVTEAGLRTRKGNRLAKQSVRQMLENPVYAGLLKSKLTGADPIRGNWEPLISRETHEIILGILAGGSQGGRKHEADRAEFCLKGYVQCGRCERPMTASWSRGRSKHYPYYHCPFCRGQSISAPKLEHEFLALLEQCKPTEGYVRLFRKIVLDVLSQQAAEASARRKAATQARAELQRQEAKILDLLIAGTIDDATYQSRLKKIRIDLAGALMEARESEEEFDDVEGLLAFAQTVYLEPAKQWRKAPPYIRKQLQDLYFPGGLTWSRPGRVGTGLKPRASKACAPDAPAWSYWLPVEAGYGIVMHHLHRLERIRIAWLAA